MMKKTFCLIVVIVIITIYFRNSFVPEFNGIDISHHNKVNWENIKTNKNIKFCYIKATEGKSFKDPMCKKHAKKAKECNLHIGLYHYFRTDVSASAQFDNFRKIYENVYSDLIPVIDVENQGNNFSDLDGVSQQLLELINLFEKEFNCKPIIYIGNLKCAIFIPLLYDCPIWLRAVGMYNYLPNATIKQTAIINNLDMNYCKDINDIILK